MVPPGQSAGEGGVTVTVGMGFTVIVCVTELVQVAKVPVMVYVVVVKPLKVTVAPVVALKPTDGDQV
jgi:hypothetical protein